MCFASQGVQQLTDNETMVIEAFGTAGSVILSYSSSALFYGQFCRA